VRGQIKKVLSHKIPALIVEHESPFSAVSHLLQYQILLDPLAFIIRLILGTRCEGRVGWQDSEVNISEVQAQLRW